MKKYLIILGAVLTVLYVSNQGVVFIEGLFIHYHFQTENKEFEYVLISNKHKDETVLEKFNRFKAKNPEMDHLILYRTFEKNYLKFWNWRTYWERKIYKYPYLEIEP
jgi:hypothetical protein